MHQRAQLGLVRSYQITSVFTRLTVQDNLALAIQAGNSQTVESSFQFWKAARREQTRYARAAEVAERVGLQAQLMQPAGALSHGEQRQLEVGLALATSPKLMLLDEPMAGMGPDESERMVQLLQSLRGHTTLLLVEHDMDAVFRLADTISVLVSGQVIACGTAEQIKNDAAVKRAYLGDE
jgi:branched-chain amino acid transport system ATP-binding protein